MGLSVPGNFTAQGLGQLVDGHHGPVIEDAGLGVGMLQFPVVQHNLDAIAFRLRFGRRPGLVLLPAFFQLRLRRRPLGGEVFQVLLQLGGVVVPVGLRYGAHQRMIP